MSLYPVLVIDKTKDNLVKQGYWFYIKNINPSLTGVGIPITKTGLIINWIGHVYWPLFVLLYWVPSPIKDKLHNFNEIILLSLFFGPYILAYVFLRKKMYDPRLRRKH